MGGKGFPIETYDWLLRDLLTCGLVTRENGQEAQGWHLDAGAQERLDFLAVAVGAWPDELTSYVDRQCPDCRRRQLTWVRKNPLVCDLCWQKHLFAQPALAHSPVG